MISAVLCEVNLTPIVPMTMFLSVSTQNLVFFSLQLEISRGNFDKDFLMNFAMVL
jgi:hypothetical protein